MKTLQMQSCVHDNGTVECTLVEVAVPEPGPDEVRGGSRCCADQPLGSGIDVWRGRSR